MVKRNLRVPVWSDFILDKIETKGFYILKQENNKQIYFGPFKSASIAEFFNYLAFISPYDLDGHNLSKNNIVNINKNKYKSNGVRRLFLHPRYLQFENSQFSEWWIETYGHELTSLMALKLARECGKDGYIGFINWLLSGSKIDNKSIYTQLI